MENHLHATSRTPSRGPRTSLHMARRSTKDALLLAITLIWEKYGPSLAGRFLVISAPLARHFFATHGYSSSENSSVHRFQALCFGKSLTKSRSGSLMTSLAIHIR